MSLVEYNPECAELAAQILYTLCWYPRTSRPVMQLMRDSADFFSRHLDAVSTPDPSLLSRVQVASHHHYTAWILKMIALELHTGNHTQRTSNSNSNQHQHQQLYGALSSLHAQARGGGGGGGGGAVGSASGSQSQLVEAILELDLPRFDAAGRGARRRMLQLLDGISLEADPVQAPELRLLDISLVNDAFKRWTRALPGREGAQHCNVPNMLQQIREQLGQAHDYEALEEELREVARIAEQSNANSQLRASKAHVLRAWHRAVGVALLKYPLQTTPARSGGRNSRPRRTRETPRRPLPDGPALQIDAFPNGSN